ncbi:MAG: HAMP domain-containing sensor histidine kinase [Syntrophales bacterium]|nr:HAMP domain-containing sensor histidine kinase [Syntrophales bacterium]MDD5641610.1 HAMP domain-containing sensor histidine kinase [Syntrophales bacterium]
MNDTEKRWGEEFPGSESPERLRLELPKPSFNLKIYPFLGLILGVFASLIIGHPLAMVALNVQEYIHNRAPLELGYRILHSFSPRMWPMLSLYIVSGAIFGAGFGIIYQKLVENRLHVEQLYQEFELQVASLRHHYKNLTIGIQGFAQRIKRKVTDLTRDINQCHGPECAIDNCFCRNLPALEQDVNTLVQTTQRLNETLGKELVLLKVLTGSTLVPQPQDFYPVLKAIIQDLVELRFRDKQIEVLVNGQPFETCRDALVFNFDLAAMQVILENILSNAMKYGDKVQVVTKETNNKVTCSIVDNGPGFEIGELQKQLLSLRERREAESTRLGLKVSLHLLEKCGGEMFVLSKPGVGSTFTLEFPK